MKKGFLAVALLRKANLHLTLYLGMFVKLRDGGGARPKDNSE